MKEIFNGIIEFDLFGVGWKPGLPGGKPPRKMQIYDPSATFLFNSAEKLALAVALVESLTQSHLISSQSSVKNL
jgi:hypothetical protein